MPQRVVTFDHSDIPDDYDAQMNNKGIHTVLYKGSDHSTLYNDLYLSSACWPPASFPFPL